MLSKIIKKDLKSVNTKVIKDDYLRSKDKEFFPYTGTNVFCGLQGQGKTISMVKVLLDIKKEYPKCIIVTNLKLNVDFDYRYVSTMEELGLALTNINNDKYGVVYAIDEIHTYFNALDSKNIPMYVFTEISQQRKQRKLILGTSQLFLRMAKPFREQCTNLIMCECYAGKFNLMRVYRGDTIEEDFGKITGELKKIGFFMQTSKLRNSYDTMQKVVSGREEYEKTIKFKQL